MRWLPVQYTLIQQCNACTMRVCRCVCRCICTCDEASTNTRVFNVTLFVGVNTVLLLSIVKGWWIPLPNQAQNTAPRGHDAARAAPADAGGQRRRRYCPGAFGGEDLSPSYAHPTDGESLVIHYIILYHIPHIHIFKRWESYKPTYTLYHIHSHSHSYIQRPFSKICHSEMWNTSST